MMKLPLPLPQVLSSVGVRLLSVVGLILALGSVRRGAVVLATTDGKIVNGTAADDGEFPFAVSLRRAASGRHTCGASLVNRAWVLTAAHCVARARPAQLNVQYGGNTLDPNSTSLADVAGIFIHERYDPNDRYVDDIALLRLAAPIRFGRRVQAVRLPQMLQPTPDSAAATLIGWGLNATGGNVQRRLQKVQLQIYSDAECGALHQVELHATNICAGVRGGGKGQCSGDSGGPLLVDGIQVGVVSWSRKPCTVAPYPGVFTELSAYIDWMLDTIAKDAQNNDDDDDDDDDDTHDLLSGSMIIARKKHPIARLEKVFSPTGADASKERGPKELWK